LPAIRRLCHETPVVGFEVVEVAPPPGSRLHDGAVCASGHSRSTDGSRPAQARPQRAKLPRPRDVWRGAFPRSGGVIMAEPNGISGQVRR
jgi:hypothetical protein